MQVQAPFELRMNVTDTEFVVVENMTVCDTSAVILKVTNFSYFNPHVLLAVSVTDANLLMLKETMLSQLCPDM